MLQREYRRKQRQNEGCADPAPEGSNEAFVTMFSRIPSATEFAHANNAAGRRSRASRPCAGNSARKEAEGRKGLPLQEAEQTTQKIERGEG